MEKDSKIYIAGHKGMELTYIHQLPGSAVRFRCVEDHIAIETDDPFYNHSKTTFITNCYVVGFRKTTA